jgi:hypothetical protein
MAAAWKGGDPVVLQGRGLEEQPHGRSAGQGPGESVGYGPGRSVGWGPGRPVDWWPGGVVAQLLFQYIVAWRRLPRARGSGC